MVKFPRLLDRAILKGSKIYFDISQVDISDVELVEYMDYKSHHKISVLTPARLRKLHKKNIDREAIFKVFKNNKKTGYLG